MFIKPDEVVGVDFTLHLPLIPKGAPSLLYPAYDAAAAYPRSRKNSREDGVQGYEALIGRQPQGISTGTGGIPCFPAALLPMEVGNLLDVVIDKRFEAAVVSFRKGGLDGESGVCFRLDTADVLSVRITFVPHW